MSGKTVKIAIVVLVAIALIAVGAYFILKKTDDSITGDFELKDGAYAIMDGDEDPKFYEEFSDKTLKIENARDGCFTISWVGSTFYCAFVNSTITTTGFVDVKGSEYAIEGGGKYNNGVLFLSALGMNSNGKLCVFNAVFVKSGSDKSASLQNHITEGDEYNSSKVIRSINGEFGEITDTEKLNVKVLKSYKGICVLQNTLTMADGPISYKSLGVVANDQYYYVGDTHFEKKWVDMMKIADDHLTIMFNGQITSGENLAVTFTMINDEPFTPGSRYESLSGLAFSGKARLIDNNELVVDLDSSLTFGTVNGNIVEAVFKIGNFADSELVQLMSNKNGGWDVYFNSNITGGYTITNVIGHISKDLKTINLLTGSFKFYSSCASSVIKLTKSEGSDLVGFYYPEPTVKIVLDDLGGTGKISKFGMYFTIDNVKGGLFSGTYMSRVINGSLTKSDNATYLMFCLKNNNEGYITFQHASISDDGGVTVQDTGIAYGNRSMAAIVNFSKEGKTPSFDEMNKQLFSVGDKFYAFEGLKRVGNTDIKIEELDQMLECKYSNNGLYSFEFVNGGRTTILVGFNSFGSDHVVRLAGYSNKTIVSYNINRYSDDLISFDREYWTDDDESAVITYMMTPDLSKIPGPPSVPEIGNKTYECTVNMTFKDANGTIRYYESKSNMTFSNQKSSLVTMKVNKMTINVHILPGGDNLMYNYFYKFKLDDTYLLNESYGIFSKDRSTSEIITMGFCDDGSTIACHVTLKEKS